MCDAHRYALGRRRWSLTAAIALAGLLASVGASCAAPLGDTVLAHNELVSLVHHRTADSTSLTLVAEPGVKINAQLLPSIDRGALPPLVFDAPGRTADSAYFVISPTVRIEGVHPVHGTLRASACPEGKRVCLSVALPVDLP